MLSKQDKRWLDGYWNELMRDVSEGLLRYWDAVTMYLKQKDYLKENYSHEV